MSEDLHDLIERNARWAERVVAQDAGYFKRLVGQQRPKYLWIGCADSRVPANQIVDLDPGEVFVHRNVANLVIHSDVNAQSVIQFAIEALKVEHIMVVGHYRCGGIHAAINQTKLGGVSDYWLGHIQEVVSHHREALDAEKNPHRREAMLCEFNVLEQALNCCQSVAVRNAWSRGQKLAVHGWIYKLGDGKLRHLDVSVHSEIELVGLRERAAKSIVDTRKRYYAGR